MAWKDYGIETKSRNGQLIGIAGVARSGKDTVGKFLIENHGFTRISFATAVYDGLLALNPIITVEPTYRDGYIIDAVPTRLQTIVNNIGWEAAKVKYPEIRELLQKYGTEAGRDIHGSECWISIIERLINANPDTDYVITDVRFENEVAMVKRLGGILAQINREGVTSVNSHISDQPLPTELFDVLIKNDSTLEDLEDYVRVLPYIFRPDPALAAVIQ